MPKKIALTIAATVATLMGAATYASEARNFNIPQGDLAPALESLAKETGLELIFQPNELKGIQTQGVSGRLSPEEAVARLINGTRLTIRTDSAGAILITAPNRALSNDAAAGPAADRSLWLAQTESADLQTEVPEEVVVTAAPYRFLDADTSGTTNLPLPIEAVPQSITLLSSDFMRAAGLTKESDLARYVAGVSSAGDQGDYYSTEKLRGFDTNTFYSRYLDGLPVAQMAYPEFAFFDRVELVKGPSSVTYGIAPPGGLYNFVSRRAPKTVSGHVSGELGSWASYRAEASLGGPLNQSGSLRGVGVVFHDTGESFIHHYDHEKSGAYAALEYSGDGKVTGAVNARFMHRDNTVKEGLLFYQDGRRPDLPRGFFMGDPDRSRYKADTSLLSGHLDFAATEALSFGLKANYQSISADFYDAYPYDLAADGTYNMGGFGIGEKWDTYAASLSGLYRFRAGDVDRGFLSVSATYMHTWVASDIYEMDYHGDANTVISLDEGEAGLFGKLRQWTPLPARYRVNEVNVKLVSAQSVVKITDRLSILAGGSVSDPLQRQGNRAAPVTTEFDRNVSLRGGVTYEFRQRSNVYLSYSDSFEPQTNRDVNGDLLPPVEGLQWEAGVKSRQFNGMLLLTAAAFRLEQRNSPAFAGIGDLGDYFRAQGEVRHQGVELEARGLLTPSLTVSAAVTYLDAKITADRDASLIGERRLFRPREMASAFVVKGFDSGMLRGFNVGGGVRYVGSALASYDGSARDLDGYAVVDLIAGYKSSRWSAQLSLNNLFDKFYVQGSTYDTYSYGNTLGDPLNVRLRVSHEFGGGR